MQNAEFCFERPEGGFLLSLDLWNEEGDFFILSWNFQPVQLNQLLFCSPARGKNYGCLR